MSRGLAYSNGRQQTRQGASRAVAEWIPGKLRSARECRRSSARGADTRPFLHSLGPFRPFAAAQHPADRHVKATTKIRRTVTSFLSLGKEYPRRAAVSSLCLTASCRLADPFGNPRHLGRIDRSGRRWLNELIDCAQASVEGIAKREKCSVRQINMTLSLAFLSATIVKAAIDGRLPRGIGVTRLRDAPIEWSRQHAMLGLAN